MGDPQAPMLQRERTVWDVVLGLITVIAGVVVLGHVALAGSLLLAGGVIRLIAAFQPGAPRLVMLVDGSITVVLGFMVVSQWPSSALWLLGTVLGVQLLVDGLTTATVGRVPLIEAAPIDLTAPAAHPQPQP